MQVTNSYYVPLTKLGLQDPTGLSHRAKGWSLLHLAASTGQPSSVAMLIKHGADVHGAYQAGLQFICGSLKLFQKRKGHKFFPQLGFIHAFCRLPQVVWTTWHALWNGYHASHVSLARCQQAHKLLSSPPSAYGMHQCCCL